MRRTVAQFLGRWSNVDCLSTSPVDTEEPTQTELIDKTPEPQVRTKKCISIGGRVPRSKPIPRSHRSMSASSHIQILSPVVTQVDSIDIKVRIPLGTKDPPVGTLPLVYQPADACAAAKGDIFAGGAHPEIVREK